MKIIIDFLFRLIITIIVYAFIYIIIPLSRLLGTLLIYIYYFDTSKVNNFLDRFTYFSISKISADIYTKSIFHYTPILLFIIEQKEEQPTTPFYYKNIFSCILDKRRYYKRILFENSDSIKLHDTYCHPDIFNKLKEKYKWNDCTLKHIIKK